MTVLSTDNDAFSPVCIVSDDPFSHFQGVLDRFSQIQPKLIFSVEAVVYNGKEHGHLEKLQRVVKGTRGSALGVCVCVHTCADLCLLRVLSLLMCMYVHVCAHRDGTLPRNSGCTCLRIKRGVAPEVPWATPPAPPLRLCWVHAQITAGA